MWQVMSAPLVPVSQGSPAVAAREFRGLRTLVADFPASLHLPRHAHEHPTLAVIVSGRFRKQLANGAQEGVPGSVITEPAGERHANWFGPRGARVVLLQPLVLEEDGELPWRRLFDRPRATVDPWCSALASRIAEELASPDDLSPLALQGLTIELLVAATRGNGPAAEKRPPPWLGRVEELLRVHFAHPPSMRRLAEEAGVHPVHLARVFRRHHGCTAATHVRRLRVAWAQDQLACPGASTADVALAAGFSDQSHFARVFRQIVGISPARWRRQRFAR
jgi:AraC family transcriptional regulator